MLSDKRFWIGALAGFAFATFVMPKIAGARRGRGKGSNGG